MALNNKIPLIKVVDHCLKLTFFMDKLFPTLCMCQYGPNNKKWLVFKKGQKAHLKAKFDIPYEAKKCSPQKVGSRKCPCWWKYLEIYALKWPFLKINTSGGLNLGLHLYIILKNGHFKQSAIRKYFRYGHFILITFCGEQFFIS